MKHLVRIVSPSLMCLIGSTLIFVIMSAKLDRQKQVLMNKISFLQEQKYQALDLNDLLKASSSSQNDVDFLELLLMQKLGVVPEGATKVVFVPKEGS